MLPPPDSTRRVWPLRLMAIVLFALGIVPMANLVVPGAGLQWYGQSVRLWVLWTIVVGGLALLTARLAPRFCDSLPGLFEWALLRPPRWLFMVLLGVSVCALGILFAWHLFGLEPLTIDELSLEWQGGLLASGRLFARAEPHPEFFSTIQSLSVGGRWFTHFPIGPSAVLGAGVAVGAPWIVNPILAGVGGVMVYRYVAATTTELEARAVAVLFATSPFVFFMAATQLDHVPALVAIWMAIAALPRWTASATAAHARRSAAVIGLGLGLAATLRPYDAALCALPIALFQLRELRRTPSLARSLVIQVVAGCLPVAVLLLANASTTGDPLTFAYDLLNGDAHRPGFHLDPMGEMHTPRRGIFNISAYLLRLDATLLGWPVPALLLVIAALAWQRTESRWDELALGVLATLLVGYWMFWGEGRAIGPRFLFTAAPIFLLYVARFPGALRRRMTRPLRVRAATVVAPLWFALGWLLPANAAQPNGVWALSRRAHERPVAMQSIDRAVAEGGLHHAVVFVADGWRTRLIARLSALGVRPYTAQRLVEHYDACLLQQLVDSAERIAAPSAERSRFLFGALERAPRAVAVPGAPAADQIAFDPARPLASECRSELATAQSNGAEYVRFLPRNRTDADGRLAGDIVYARDFGQRDLLLRDRFADRAWYRARVERANGALHATLEPIPH